MKPPIDIKKSTDKVDAPLQKLEVACYAGYRGEETPRRFFMGKRRIEVQRIIDRWLSPDHRYFKVLGDDNGEYILRHDTQSLVWELTFFRQT